MTNNLDQFDQSPDFDENADSASESGLKSNLVQAWQTRPIFKLIALLVGVGALVAVAINLTSSKPETAISNVAAPPTMKEPPGGKSSPAFIEAQAQANAQRIKEAAAVSGTALPVPLPSGISVEQRKEGDPLVEFRAEMKHQKEEQQRQIQALQQQNQQQQQVSVQQDQQLQEKLGTSLHAQMTQLATLWQPKSMQVVMGMVQHDSVKDGTATGSGGGSAAGTAASASNPSKPSAQQKVKPLIPAGAVHYAQLLTEANSDILSPILAQILTGPLSGAKAIGKFTTGHDLMALSFELATLKGKEYKINAIALDPETTLGGMATEVDHRYFTRVILPAAASFIQAFGAKLSEKPTNALVAGNGVVITTQAKTGITDGLYAGVGSVGQNVAAFFQAEGQATKTLVRVAVGTSMGLFFTKSVCAGEFPCMSVDVPAPAASAQAPLPVAATPASMASTAP